MTAEILKFPHNNKDLILSLLETAKLLEKTSPKQCISIQRDVITRHLQPEQSLTLLELFRKMTNNWKSSFNSASAC